ncbi:hypothetical protein ASPWEDRAFT_325944 [Aspergillus wentii DTO 134E9]|uniref:Uncharacterized protein n=1 Tax=Aspergillus wentii DTO 134E9 TaxID=1073089 RepID=A0A1L9RUB7_ASPWE|nr:uncharacterized protein ASPWEDRAFT_325944 [Aspergillus wentii DTO 134E9]OJJ38494.1 hypothetical protein ASPWEDRAFT_325944 [Aspergillus wentii DTO 134E9]
MVQVVYMLSALRKVSDDAVAGIRKIGGAGLKYSKHTSPKLSILFTLLISTALMKIIVIVCSVYILFPFVLDYNFTRVVVLPCTIAVSFNNSNDRIYGSCAPDCRVK